MKDKDAYYIDIAAAVEEGADCTGTHVGAVVVKENRIISTGYNGTPTGFMNCSEGGCVRCLDSQHHKAGNLELMSSPDHVAGAALDRCVCVHAEQNAFLTAARFGIALEGSTLYSTWSPCFTCLKEAIQVGITRIVYRKWYAAKYSPAIVQQYEQMRLHICGVDASRFMGIESDGSIEVPLAATIPDPIADIDSPPMSEPERA